jgi:hypothetical protein
VEALRSQGHYVYDFKNPDTTSDRGFHWTDADLGHLVSATDYVAALTHPAAVQGFERDFNAMIAADTFVLVLPCGRSAHLELGWAVGAGKRTAILLDDSCTPELMYTMVDQVAISLDDLLGGWPRALAQDTTTEHPVPQVAADQLHRTAGTDD